MDDKETKQLLNKLKTRNQKRAMTLLAIMYSQLFADFYNEGMRKDLDAHGLTDVDIPEATIPILKKEDLD